MGLTRKVAGGWQEVITAALRSSARVRTIGGGSREEVCGHSAVEIAGKLRARKCGRSADQNSTRGSVQRRTGIRQGHGHRVQNSLRASSRVPTEKRQRAGPTFGVVPPKQVSLCDVQRRLHPARSYGGKL